MPTAISCALAFGALWSNAQAQIDPTEATWTGGAGTSSYAEAANWDIAVVPVNDAVDQYNVTIPSGKSVLFDLDGSYEVTDLTLGTGSTLTIAPGEVLNVVDDARISGLITTAAGTFSAPGAGAQLLNNQARLVTSGTGQIALGALGCSLTRSDHRSNLTLLSSDGAGSLIDLSAATSFTSASYGAYALYRYDVVAKNGGVIDLSGVGTMTGATDDDWLRLIMQSGGDIPLTSLTATTGRIQFIVDVDDYSLPALDTTSGAYFDVRTGRTVTAGVLTSMGGSGSKLEIHDAASFNAPQLLSMDQTAVAISVNGTLDAPQLKTFTNSSITLGPNQTFNHDVITNVDFSELHVRDGVTWDLSGVQSYNNTLSDYRNDLTLLSADGTNSVLDLSEATSFTSASYAAYSTHYYDVVASNDGLIDLSKVASITGATDDDQLRLILESGGEIRLSSLKQITGRTQFRLDVESYALPELETTANTHFLVKPGRTLNVPQLVSMSGAASGIEIQNAASLNADELVSLDNTTVSIGSGGTLAAPKLEAFTNSSITLGADQTFTHGVITNVDFSELHVRDGVTWTLNDVDSYNNTLSDHRANLTLLSADGEDSLLDLSEARSFTSASRGAYNQYRYDVVATNGGVIDLSKVGTITGATEDEWLRLMIQSEGDIPLTLLTATTGRTQFILDVDDYELPSLETAGNTYFLVKRARAFTAPRLVAMSGSGGNITVEDAASFDAEELVSIDQVAVSIGSGGVLDVPKLEAFTNSSITLGANQTFNHGVITDVNYSELHVRDGVTWDLSSVESYNNTLSDHRGSLTLLSADGDNSVLDLSSAGSFTSASFGKYSTYNYDVRASNDALIDLSSVQSITGATEDEWIRFRMESGGEIDLQSLRSITGRVKFEVGSEGVLTLGNIAVTQTTQLNVNHPSADVNIGGSLYLAGGSQLSMASGAALEVAGDLLYAYTSESQLATDTAILYLTGSEVQWLEVGGEDLGPSGSSSGNFGFGRLVVGREGEPTTVMPLDLFDNGNRVGSAHEALYLYGVGGMDGLELMDGSTLVLDGVNVYAQQAGEWVHLNALFDPGVTKIAFSGGMIVVPEPSSLMLLGSVAAMLLFWRLRRRLK